jgi:hypothetical protein
MPGGGYANFRSRGACARMTTATTRSGHAEIAAALAAALAATLVVLLPVEVTSAWIRGTVLSTSGYVAAVTYAAVLSRDPVLH